MKFLNLFKVLKSDSYSDMRGDLISLIAWFQVKETEIAVSPSQSPSIVPLLNSLKKQISSSKMKFCLMKCLNLLVQVKRGGG